MVQIEVGGGKTRQTRQTGEKKKVIEGLGLVGAD
jgi:hypothetical protein